MRAAVFHGPHDVRLQDVPDPVAGPGEAVVRVERAGICGSDLNRFLHGSYPWPPPFIMGHEFCGRVAALGPGVDGWREGADVVIQPTLSCGACPYCREGHENRCVEFVRRGLTGSGTDGGFARYVRVPAYQLHARPPGMSPEVAVLVEPAAVSAHGWRLAGVVRPGAAVVVGLGNIGLLAVLVARAHGAREVIAVGKYAPRQALAAAYGATLVLEPDDPGLHERVLERTEGLGAEVVLEAAGTAGSLRTAVSLARKGGRIVVLGVIREEAPLDWRDVLMGEKQVLGSIIYRRPDFVEALRILAEGPVDPARHVTAEVPLEAIVPGGFQPLIDHRARHIKITVDPR